MATVTSQTESVSLENLDDSMVIERFIGFSNKFVAMDETTCKWLQHNFKGVKARIKRGEESLNLNINGIQTGDQLLELHTFPPSLKKLTTVNQRLILELEKRGFLKFSVKRISKQLTQKQVKHKEAVEKTSQLIHKAKESVAISSGATKAVESLMDDTRNGKMEIGDISNYVDNIIESGSTEAMGVLASLKKSDQTYAHCTDVAAIFQSTYIKLMKQKGIELSPEKKHEMLLGAFMHDIGKAKVPKDILDSTVRFERDSREMKLMQSHPAFGAEILTNMGSTDMIINMAHYHHVKLDTGMKSSYPLGINFDDLVMETRLIAIVDVYQALVGRRSYKKSWAPPAAMKFIDQLSGIEFDMDVWETFHQILGKYPVGSLVELNDGSMAFVVETADEDLDRPRVAVVRNAKGEDLTNNPLIDLLEEPDIKIIKDLDNHEALGDASMDIFTNLKIT
ncbi:MAG: HD domain-containing protein [Deltaproteobacteria bacterium]|jgi:putative nucleotidyltransferase with HDIG domain|nr:HD domain-containing protein [Deltaproteobacteria bacterium]MBT4644512.1 HD domain-containing protein [Deltaproteobacteria bacterium]MBT6500531.1 HD domain-containing protein [Deltaproteobacteria bacterium]MBT6611861.1 HD domain-containing protein [Deltaproteobacteria bacterium]MBT7151464.1 HD domain-containing protein [Deltaproteobacteria bacterium]